ncbi:MAG TPA: ATP-binding protein, partial [Trichocoleus sp.]
EIWNIIGLQLTSVLETGQATWSDDMLLPVDRYGYVEEAYFTYSYSPIYLENGQVGGAFTAVTETTQRVIGERRLKTLRELAADTLTAKAVEPLCQLVAQALASNPDDIPFALLYLSEPDSEQLQLVATAGISAGVPASPAVLPWRADGVGTWPMGRVFATGEAYRVEDLTTCFASSEPSATPGLKGLSEAGLNQAEQSITEALLLPLAQPGQTQLAGCLILGISPRRVFDDEYRSFFELVASRVATAIADVRAYAAERQRAEALAELDRAKTTFFSNISHEFRTPLTLMLGPLEELLRHCPRPLSKDQWEQLTTVHRNSLRLLKLVNTLLDFSRIEAGRLQALYEPTDLSRLTAELASVFRAAMEQAGLALTILCPPLPEPVYIDRQMWEKVVLNLLSNAFKFTFEGGITVALRWANTRIELVVQDTGIGIPASEIPHLFERFHQVPGARGRTSEGSGIGLSLVQELVTLHGGTIAVASTVNQGTCFTVSIPTGTAHLPSDQLQPEQSDPRQGTLSSLPSRTPLAVASPYLAETARWLPAEGERLEFSTVSSPLTPELLAEPSEFQSQTAPTAHILLVDDNADMRDYVQGLLRSRYHVTTASNGAVALATVRQQLPDLILSDVMMPELDGFGLLQALRSDPITQSIPVILLSARAGEESRIEGLAAGADDYLIKPFSARELLARIEATLAMAQMRQSASQREQQLRLEAQAAREQMESVLARIDDQFLALDREWRYVYVNSRVVEVVGLSREELLGRSIWELFPQTVDTPFYDALHQAVAEQKIIRFEYFYPTWQRWFENRVYPSENGVSVFVAEITERKQTEDALQEVNRRLQLALQAGQMIVWDIDLARDRIVCSENARDLFGISEGTQADFLTRIYPEDLPHVLRVSKQALLNDAPYVVEYRVLRAQDEVRWLMGQGSVVQRDAQGQAERLAGISLDITERVQTETALRQSEERYRYLTNAIPQMVWMANSEGELLDVNQRWSEFTGLTLDAAQSSGWPAVVHPDDVPIMVQQWQQAQQARAPYQAEGRMRRHDGVYRWYLHQALPVKNAQGDIVHWFGTATDIEDQKQLEQQREQLMQQSLNLLRQEQAAREQAEVANRIKDEFLAVLSHELRSPLNPILGWANLLRHGQLDAAKTAYGLETIERNAKLQVQLIEDLLDVSRILRGKLSLTIIPLDLVATVKAALETVRLAAEAKSIAIATHIEPNLASTQSDSTPRLEILGDAARLQQIVWNLLSNAVKFTPAGGRVDIYLKQVEQEAALEDQGMTADGRNGERKPGNLADFTSLPAPSPSSIKQPGAPLPHRTYAQIIVSDTGKGIAPAFLPQVFEYFRQADSTTTRTFGGLGLGLAIVRHLVELHGGTVQAESLGEGQGATFTVQLPLRSPHSRAAATQTALSAGAFSSAGDDTPLSGCQVLLVDDDDDSRDLTAWALQQAGATVTPVVSAAAALEALR